LLDPSLKDESLTTILATQHKEILALMDLSIDKLTDLYQSIYDKSTNAVNLSLKIKKEILEKEKIPDLPSPYFSPYVPTVDPVKKYHSVKDILPNYQESSMNNKLKETNITLKSQKNTSYNEVDQRKLNQEREQIIITFIYICCLLGKREKALTAAYSLKVIPVIVFAILRSLPDVELNLNQSRFAVQSLIETIPMVCYFAKHNDFERLKEVKTNGFGSDTTKNNFKDPLIYSFEHKNLNMIKFFLNLERNKLLVRYCSKLTTQLYEEMIVMLFKNLVERKDRTFIHLLLPEIKVILDFQITDYGIVKLYKGHLLIYTIPFNKNQKDDELLTNEIGIAMNMLNSLNTEDTKGTKDTSDTKDTKGINEEKILFTLNPKKRNAIYDFVVLSEEEILKGLSSLLENEYSRKYSEQISFFIKNLNPTYSFFNTNNVSFDNLMIRVVKISDLYKTRLNLRQIFKTLFEKGFKPSHELFRELFLKDNWKIVEMYIKFSHGELCYLHPVTRDSLVNELNVKKGTNHKKQRRIIKKIIDERSKSIAPLLYNNTTLPSVLINLINEY
jgi:hypothetical protein